MTFVRDESGAAAAEYALILAIIGVGIVTALGGLQTAISGAIDTASTAISG
ncbi:Flp family type IVb pilin [Phenylobacterium soli]|uniref:Flp family type IVb pilin n=2 Tax=Phenylobacterium soli TaxID=2170551 RepID=A0A328APA5_9CAUL|nr:Flp family type IVb pilin [Phenylobacterium soli]